MTTAARTVAAALAGALLAGCAGTAPAPVEPLTSGTVAESVKVGKAPLFEYQDVSGQVPAPDPVEGRWGSVPLPGVKIGHRDSAGEVQACTIGPAVEGGFLTAGHCADGNGDQYLQTDPVGQQVARLGTVTASATGPGDDWALIPVTVPQGAEWIAGKWPIRDVMAPNEIRALPPGTPICIDGTKSGVVCSRLVEANADWILYEHRTTDGDSGAPVFVVTPDGDARLLGVHHGVPVGSFDGAASYLQPILRLLSAEPVTA